MDNEQLLSKAEQSLLTYLETRAVDRAGRVDARRMNREEFEIVERWNEEGFLRFGRIKSKDHNADGTHWVELSDEAWAAVAAVRMAQGKSGVKSKFYERVGE